MTPTKPTTPFNFGAAITQPFQSEDGKAFAWRLLFWTAGPIAIVFLAVIPFYGKAYPALLEFNWMNFRAMTGEGRPPDPDIVWDVFARVWPAYLFQMLGMWIVYAMGEAALHRKLLFGQELPKRPITFGRHEFLVLLTQLGVFAIWFGVYFLGIFATMFIAALIGQAVAILGGLIALIGMLFILAMMIYVPVRLAPAAAISIRKGDAFIPSARHVTKFRFWRLFGAYLVLGLLGYVAISVMFSLGLWAVTGHEDIMMAMSGLSEENPRIIFEEIGPRLKNPLVMALGVLFVIAYSALYVLWSLCMSGIAIYALKWWEADQQA